ncbi:tRNA (adenosine(37)-N6)-threonylcarbamoyltransferase complex dimerization subunit type 1 TsaB [Sulfitobacter sediminilitoris]|uniref:tRNA (adenosine(37)-N6)-threonylcarbamoyltransferase complex dimerization subunit type 1 TsaB n=1 Tax=Sulfitobacter sediminilitoris TaxID=2698830 RepID=UPI00361A0584
MPDKVYPENRKKWPKVVAFDTSGPFVSVGWAFESYSGGNVLNMPRGQAEALLPAIEDTLASCGWTWSEVDVIGVAVGPGNFTGIRIGVSAARGLGLALGIPVFGISQFELAYGTIPVDPGTLVSIPAPRNMAYVRGFGAGGQQACGTGLLIDPGAPPPSSSCPQACGSTDIARAKSRRTRGRGASTNTTHPMRRAWPS